MTLWSSVDCEEVHGTRKEGRSWKDGPKMSVTLETDYANRYLLSEDLFKNGIWPFVAGNDARPRVQNIEIEFLPTEYDTDEQVIVYKKVHLDVTYNYDQSAGQESGGGGSGGAGRQLYTETLEPNLEVLAMLDHQFYWNEEDPPVNLKYHPIEDTNFPTVRDYSLNVTRTFYNWISVPISFLNLMGHVNNKVETLLGISFPIDTLQFIPKSISRAVSTEGTEGFTVQVNFGYQKGGWNKTPIPNLGVGAGITRRILYFKDKKDPAATRIEFKPYILGDFTEWIF